MLVYLLHSGTPSLPWNTGRPYVPTFSFPSHIAIVCDVIECLIMHSGLYSNTIWTASIGSSSGPHVFPFPVFAPFASLSHLLRNILPTLLYSVIHLVVFSGFLFIEILFLSPFYFPRFCQDGSMFVLSICPMYIYIFCLLLTSLYIICAPSLVSSSVYNPSYYSSSLAIVTAIYGLLFFVLISLICSERIFFSGDSTSGVFVPP